MGQNVPVMGFPTAPLSVPVTGTFDGSSTGSMSNSSTGETGMGEAGGVAEDVVQIQTQRTRDPRLASAVRDAGGGTGGAGAGAGGAGRM
jgi:hypothetical protein